MPGLFRLALVGAVAALTLSACDKPTTVERFERHAEANTAEGKALEAFRSASPPDFARLREELERPDAANLTDKEVSQRASKAMRQYLAAFGRRAGDAPTANLVEMGVANRDFTKALQGADPVLCAKFGMVGLSVTDTLDAKSEEALNRLLLAHFKAVEASRAHLTPHTDVTPADAAKLAELMKTNGADQRLINLIAGGLDSASPADKCAAGAAMYAAVAALPPEDSARWTAYFLKHTASGR